MSNKLDLVVAESKRIQVKYQRGGQGIAPHLYEYWRLETALMTGRARHAAAMLLHQLNVFLKAGSRV